MAFRAIGSLYGIIILGMFKQVFYSVTLIAKALKTINEKVAMVTCGNSKNQNEDPEKKIDWISLLSFDLLSCPLAENPFPLFRPSK